MKEFKNESVYRIYIKEDGDDSFIDFLQGVTCGMGLALLILILMRK